jgi:hypothetical protein
VLQIMPQLLHFLGDATAPATALSASPPAAAAAAAAAAAPAGAASLTEAKSVLAAATMDWGVLAVYTCGRSCDAVAPLATAYLEEFVWKQPMRG